MKFLILILYCDQSWESKSRDK